MLEGYIEPVHGGNNHGNTGGFFQEVHGGLFVLLLDIDKFVMDVH